MYYNLPAHSLKQGEVLNRLAYRVRFAIAGAADEELMMEALERIYAWVRNTTSGELALPPSSVIEKSVLACGSLPELCVNQLPIKEWLHIVEATNNEDQRSIIVRLQLVEHVVHRLRKVRKITVIVKTN